MYVCLCALAGPDRLLEWERRRPDVCAVAIAESDGLSRVERLKIMLLVCDQNSSILDVALCKEAI